eukprot:TRINITY_DN563_c0_g1_i3.p1 TRINITY_DN563_c0_g1~~TRINITY_DN563_c0_g1_i3.p1  ORF type:complete len:556 (+),score=110.08 TRINITY_DN563_c0_g1_i3:61-1728(+)
MDLLSGYDSDQEEEKIPLSSSSSSSSLPSSSSSFSAAPNVSLSSSPASSPSFAIVPRPKPVDEKIDLSTSTTDLALPSSKVVFYNPTFDQMWAPIQGPTHPDLESNASKNTLTGFVEKHAMETYSFNENYYSAIADPTIRFDRKRKPAGDATEPSSYLGPWAPYEVEVLSKEEALKQKEEKQKEQEEEKKSKKEDGEGSDDESEGPSNKKSKTESSGSEKTLFHGDSVYDYQGRTYMDPPPELRNEEHECYIPKKLAHTWNGHTKGVNAIRFFPNSGHLLLSASMDSTIKIWDVYNKQKCLRSYLGHAGAVRDICFTNDGRHFVSASYDKYIKCWDTETGQCVGRFTTKKVPYCVKLNPDADKQNEFICGQSNKKIAQWDMRANAVVQEYDEHLGPVNALLFVDDNRRFVSTSDDKKMFIWEYGIPVVIKHIAEPHMHSMPAMALHPNTKWLIAQSLDNQVLCYGARDKFRLNRKKRFAGHLCAGYAAQVSFSPDGRFVCSGDGEGRAFFWDWKTCKIFKKLKCHDQVTIGIEWHPIEPSKVATCSWDGTIKYWD